MIYIYGDSHSSFSFRNLKFDNTDLNCPSITMFRIGRDNIIINFDKENIQKNDIIVITYGEIDCRCHIQRQINLGLNEDDIINKLVNDYFKTLKNNFTDIDVKIIILGVIPPVKQYDFEQINDPLFSDVKFIGSDEDRVRFTNKMNTLLEELSNENNYIYFNPYSYYTRPDGTLKYEFSDGKVHLGENTFFLERFNDLYTKININTV